MGALSALSCSGDHPPTAPAVTVELTVPSAELDAGDTLRLVAKAAGAGASAATTFAWASSDTSILTVDPAGLVTGRRPGSAIVTAALGTAKASKPLVVNAGITIRFLSPTQGAQVGRFVTITGVITAPRGIRDAQFFVNEPQSAFGNPTYDHSNNVENIPRGVVVDTFQIPVANYGVGFNSGSYVIRLRVFDQTLRTAFDSLKFTVAGFSTSIDSGRADTLFQRSLTVAGRIDGADDYSAYELVMDPGTAAQHVVARPGGRAPATWRYSYPDTLSVGRHTLVSRLRNSTGVVVDSAVFNFVVARKFAAYQLTPLSSDPRSIANGINESGTIVGSTEVNGVSTVGVWEGSALRFHSLATPAGLSAYGVRAINSAGDVAGYMATGPEGCQRVAVVWRHDQSGPTAVNQQTCLGALDLNDNLTVLVDPSLLVQSTGSVTAAANSFACHLTSLNNRDQAVGGSSLIYGTFPCGLNISFSVPDIPSGTHANVPTAVAVNDSGVVAGYVTSFGPVSLRSFVSQGVRSATPPQSVDLGAYIGWSTSLLAATLNNRGVVAIFDTDRHRVLLYDAYSRRTTDVNVALGGWVITSIVGINDAGVIAANATDPSGASRGVVLSPLP